MHINLSERIAAKDIVQDSVSDVLTRVWAQCICSYPNFVGEGIYRSLYRRNPDLKRRCIESISRGQVSNITRELNKQVQAFRNRRLEKTYPVLWVDALYEKIRYDNRVINMAVEVVIGVDTEGKRDILAIEPMQEESRSNVQELV